MRISTSKSKENLETILQILKTTSKNIKELANQVKDTERPLVEGKRSFNETIAHLINCDIASTDAIFLALMKKEPQVEKVHPERDIGKLLRLDKMDTDILLPYFDIRRVIFLKVLEELRYMDWDRIVVEPWKKRNESVYWKCRGQALHEKHHIEILTKQIECFER